MNMRDLDPDTLPWSVEAEAGVLGGLMLRSDALDEVGDLLEAKHFFDDRHGRVFAAMQAMVLACKPVDPFTVKDFVDSAGTNEGIDLAFLNDLAQSVPSANNIRRYAEIVAERALLRGLIEAGAKVQELGHEVGMTVADRLDKAMGHLQALQLNRGRSVPVLAAEAAVRMMDRISALADGTMQPGIPTGIYNLDRRLGGGLRPGKQVVLAARPSIGKSSLAQQIALNFAKAGHAAAFFSQEMPVDELADRATSNLGSVLLEHIVEGKLTNDDWPRLTEACDELAKIPLFFDDQPALTLHDITAKARALKRQADLKLLVIDYIQLCGSRAGADKRHHQIEEISRGLKTLAKQLEITIITISQLSRGVEARGGGRPMLSDLKESGAIEEDADVVILLSLNQSLPGMPKVIEAFVAKNRQGRIGSLPLDFEGGYQRWTASRAELEHSKPTTRQKYTEDV